MMINLTADKARQITEESNQTFKRELIDKIESDIMREASKGYNGAVTTKFLHTESFSLLGEKYREDIQSIENQLEEVGYTVVMKETDISKTDLGIDADVQVSIKVSW